MRLMPGRFVVLDIEEYFGVDAVAMQEALVAKKSVLMHVDAGITKVRRNIPQHPERLTCLIITLTQLYIIERLLHRYRTS